MSRWQAARAQFMRPGGLTALAEAATKDIGAALERLLVDVLALYLQTKGVNHETSLPHIRDYHLLVDDEGVQVFAATEPRTDRVRKNAGITLRLVGHIARGRAVTDKDAKFVEPVEMLTELRDDSLRLTLWMRQAHDDFLACGDSGTSSPLEVWIDEAERRIWFLYETARYPRDAG
ncbi:MAG: DNA starvation/stationary phase protection protein [Rhodospirillales bacterium]